ncbi:MAG: N-acetylneuraminate synthase family protein, partial [Thaumarchaeota archaeon]|nr:N-acetylneuraminate synthase family protein [Nitrososphaerota archaeon]
MIIAEVGKNHHGSEDYAKEYLRKSIASGVDGILYHIREKEFYQKIENRKKSLPKSFYKNALTFTKKKKKKFGITLADVEKIDFLEEIGVDFYKILSQDINNKILIKNILKTNKPTYISTGLSNFTEISKL